MENPAPEDAILASVQGSTGVDQDRGMGEEKRKDDRPAEGGALNSGRLTAPDVPEEPGAAIPHAGICKGGVGQPASLP